jgi:Ca2+-binding RTX toxin-like protein
MKKAMMITLAVLAASYWAASTAVGPAFGQGREPTYTVLLAGGEDSNSIRIWLTSDGRTYVIESDVPLEVAGTICEHPPGVETELNCRAVSVSSFMVNAVGGDDQVRVASSVTIPVTLRGGPGNDVLVGGSGNDSLYGGPGNDKLVGRLGNDVLVGGPGNDELIGGAGNDVLRGGPGRDALFGGAGKNVAQQSVSARVFPTRRTRSAGLGDAAGPALSWGDRMTNASHSLALLLLLPLRGE